ncbi:MAG: DUF3408 domain-containing protein [Flavobacteriaceae bacterium]|uniref:DUF3408 domain-containing protein n=1 Tax=Flavobacterium sp. Leaf359 TaxID=1736351 RepID=UPI0006F6D878|nr:DUF3408 domain-containing protein [Flavobacterium sp. Leaf359]KQS45706.1 conjugal transfer protein TraB [Flavobacterium sp. Leaf359]PZO30306.1 MAG: DUF3408 domain-containing protein [Flavobacteriaceae bacterium]
MIHEENKNQQPEKEDFSIENFLTDEKKQPLTEQQAVTHREDFAKPEVDEEIAKPSAKTTKKSISMPKKLNTEDYCKQFFKIPTTTASKGKSVYVRQEYHDKFNRLTGIMGIDKLTIYAYLDNIIEYHFQEFGELISEIYNDKHKPLF